MLQEAPLITVEDVEEDGRDNEAARAKRILKAFRELSAADREEALGAYCPDRELPGSEAWPPGVTEDDFKMLVIFAINTIASGPATTGFYPLSARANHSCRPNASFSLSDGVDRENKLVVTQPLRAGDEVLPCYINETDLLRPRARRQKLISNTWNFKCLCVRCSEPDDVRIMGCPACAGEGRRGRVTFDVECEPMVEGADARGRRWTQCTECGTRPSAEKMANLEDDWLRQCTELPKGVRSMDRLRHKRYRSAIRRRPLPPPPEGTEELLALHARLVEANNAVGGEVAPVMGGHWLAGLVVGLAAEVYLLLGRAEEASEAAEQRLAFVRRVRELGDDGLSMEDANNLACQGAAAKLEGNEDMAIELFGEALQVLQAFGEVEEELEEYLMSELESLGVEVQFSGGPEDAEPDESEPDYSGFEFRETSEESSELEPGEMRFLGMAEPDAEAK